MNPYDIRSPLTLTFINEEHFHVKRFSLDLPDAELDAYLADLLRDDPRRLHEMAAQDPVAATRCFHQAVRLVIKELFGCRIWETAHADGTPAEATPGIFGYISGFLGAVEPQMRKALHVHMLVQLIGFAHPLDIFEKHNLPKTFRRVWYFVARAGELPRAAPNSWSGGFCTVSGSDACVGLLHSGDLWES